MFPVILLIAPPLCLRAFITTPPLVKVSSFDNSDKFLSFINGNFVS